MKRMVTVARDAQGKTPTVPSSFHEALGNVGPTLQDFPWDREIVEETHRSIDAVTDIVNYCEAHALLRYYIWFLHVLLPNKYQPFNKHNITLGHAIVKTCLVVLAYVLSVAAYLILHSLYLHSVPRSTI